MRNEPANEFTVTTSDGQVIWQINGWRALAVTVALFGMIGFAMGLLAFALAWWVLWL